MTLLPCCVGKREAVVGMSAHPAATCWPSRDGWDCEIFQFFPPLLVEYGTGPIALALALLCSFLSRYGGKKRKTRKNRSRTIVR